MAAYFILHNRIRDGHSLDEYIPKAIESWAQYEPEILVLEENSDVIEGSTAFPRTIVIRFKSRADAEAWYNSPEYQSILPLRLAAIEGFTVLVDEFNPAA